MAASTHVLTDDAEKVLRADKSNYVSKNIMTKYELNQLIGLRTMHLSRGAPPLVDTDEYDIKSNMDLRAIAIREMLEGKLPYIVKRTMPNNKIEYWEASKLDLVAVRHMLRDAPISASTDGHSVGM
jgi:DNA-directed RNA polymerase subunit K/omega